MLWDFEVIFIFLKKVRSVLGLSGGPNDLSARLKLQSSVTGLNLANFANLEEDSATNSHILNKIQSSKLRKIDILKNAHFCWGTLPASVAFKSRSGSSYGFSNEN